MASPSRRTLAAVAAGGIVSIGAVFLPAAAYAATAPITSAGPLTRVEISDVLNCAVDHTGDSASEWYGQTACGTLLAASGTLYGPAAIPAGGGAAPRTTWTPVSQSAVTGAGTSANPYKVVTVADAGGSGLRLTQTDTYVTGEESYRTEIAVANTGAAATTATLYRAGDCYLQNSDVGYGAVDAATGAVSCTAGNEPGARIEQMLPLTTGSHYYESFYGSVWSRIGQQLPFPDTCDCATSQDNGLGLSWDVSLAAGASKTYSSLVTFSPLGRSPLTIAKTADAASAQAGGTDGYTITVTNNNVSPVTLASLTDTLGAGFSYRTGTTTGASTADPAVTGQTLSWSGITVPAGGTATVHFGVTVSSVAGTYTDEADGSAEGYTVVGTGPVAPVTVTAVVTPPPNTPPTAGPVTVSTPQDTPVAIALAGSDVDGDALAYTVATQPGHGTLAGTGANLTYTPATGYSGTDSFTYAVNDGHVDSAPATVSITVTPVVTPPATGPALDARVSADAHTACGRLTAPALSTHAGNELVLAFVTADGPSNAAQRVTGVTGGGLTWTLVKRANATGGTAEVWQAYATTRLTGAVVRATVARAGYDGSITVAAFSGAAAHAGASAAAAGRTGAPAATLTATAAGSLIWATGHDWTHNTNPVPGAEQVIVHKFLDARVHDSFWVQQRATATTGPTPVTVNDTGLSRDRWQLVAVEIPAAS
jgi:uncharacterized repeat protein (TIGR01451 family)